MSKRSSYMKQATLSLVFVLPLYVAAWLWLVACCFHAVAICAGTLDQPTQLPFQRKKIRDQNHENGRLQ